MKILTSINSWHDYRFSHDCLFQIPSRRPPMPLLRAMTDRRSMSRPSTGKILIADENFRLPVIALLHLTTQNTFRKNCPLNPQLFSGSFKMNPFNHDVVTAQRDSNLNESPRVFLTMSGGQEILKVLCAQNEKPSYRSYECPIPE